mgnify:CR=1 FL=1
MTEIRFAVPEDLQDILDIYAPYVTGSTITFEYQLPTRQDFALRMAQVQAVYPWLVFVRDGTVEGYAYASAFNPRAAYDWSADLSVYMAQDCRGRGAGRQLYGCLLQLLALQGVRRVYGLVTDPNPASMAFHSAMGFKKAGYCTDVGFKNGRWLGVNFVEKSLSDRTDAPQPLKPVGALPPDQTAAVLAGYRRD